MNVTSAIEMRTEDTTLLPATRLVDEYEARDVSAHPLFVSLRENPVDLRAIWFLVANTHAGISPHFVRWLAQTIARIDDRRIASLMAKQLNDELGNGDCKKIHSDLLDRFVTGLDGWRPRDARGDVLRPGKRLGERSTALFEADDPYEAVGALIVAEIFAKKMDRCLGDEIRRQSAISPDALAWLTIHEVLEVDHAEDSGALAALVKERGPSLAATWRGAIAQWTALWEFLDGVAALALPRKAAQAHGHGGE
ncbi:iron-containing redox enzyme family protein [Sorangium sp. So ce128]|uniref:iron-containing redox enzyme family protein n=1 Tax=Sorangium sp. So ce128 TaxID=3133281 RepID=UPI003F646F04